MPIVVATATTGDAERLHRDLVTFLGDGAVELFPAWETLPFERVSPTIETMGLRLRTLWRLRTPERTPLVVVVVPPAGVSTSEQDVAALCAEARRLGRESVVVWCAHPAMSFAGDTAGLTIACWSPTAGMLRAAGRWLLRRT